MDFNAKETDRGAHFTVVEDTPTHVIIKDVGPHDQYPTVTNDAEGVVQRLLPELHGRKLYYYDTDGMLDQLVIRDGKFDRFSYGGPDGSR